MRPTYRPTPTMMRKINVRPLIVFSATLVVCATGPSQASELLYYDPTGTPTEHKAPEADSVTITFHRDKHLLTIPPKFYGVNIHPGSAAYEIAQIDVLKALKPDAIRIMTRMRVDWPADKSGRIVTPLSPAPGVYDWNALDLLIRSIVAVGAEPYLALGFGPPHWMTDSPDLSSRRPPLPEYLSEYAEMMASIVERYVVEKKWPIRRVTIENEPENVGYDIDTYIELSKAARRAIKQRVPNVEIGGPAIGYAMWPQSNGRSISFHSATNILSKETKLFDFYDWHIYSTTTDPILKTVETVQRAYGSELPLVISELNRDWRYSGEYKKVSQKNNTEWSSVSWLAETLDRLQLSGVDQVFYFAWRESTLGLVDARFNELRPNYHLLSVMINELGRKRIEATFSNNSVGTIATIENNKISALIYNKTTTEVSVNTNAKEEIEIRLYDKKWHAENKNITDPFIPSTPKPFTPSISNNKKESIKIPPSSYILIKEK